LRQSEEFKRERDSYILKVDFKNYCNLDEDNPELIEQALEMFYKEMNIAA
jgi:hypothetical protein